MKPTKTLEQKRKKGFYIYPLFLIAVWFSKNHKLTLTLATIGVLFVCIHQGYYLHKIGKRDNIEIGF